MIVKDIPFQVNGQIIKFSTAAQLVANSAGFATASFSFSTDWSEYDTIKVIFTNGETKKSRILTTGQYTVLFPSECMTAGRIAVSAVGLTGAEGEETFKRATTERNNGVEVVASGAFEGIPADLPTPTEAEEILLIATNANATAAQANTTANTANLNASAAVLTANTASTNASTALSTANGIDAKATTALSQSTTAVSTANSADSKAQQALDTFPYAVMGNTIYGGTIADNLNTIIKNGFYTCYGGATGAPGTTTSWFVTHQNSNAGTITATQYASSFVENLVAYKRNKIGSAWQPWERFPDTRYKGLRLAAQSIVPDGTTATTIEIDKYTDGTPLNSVLGGEVRVKTKANASFSSTSNCFLQTNKATSGYWHMSGTGQTSILVGTLGNVVSNIKCLVDVSDSIDVESFFSYATSSSGNSGNRGGGMTTPQTAVTAIKLLIGTGTFPAGTVVEWWERG